MIWAEIILILIGVVFIGVSFFVSEKLSQQDLDQISLMSQTDLKRISENQVKEMRGKVEQALEDIFDESLEIVQRGLEKETNNKIMAVSEYSDTVLEKINNTHNEITFLYSMLNEKQAEAAQMVGDLQKITKQIRDMDLEKAITKAEAVSSAIVNAEKNFEPIQMAPVEVVQEEKAINEVVNRRAFSNVSEETGDLSKNEQILLLYKEGKDEVEIAKTLDCGLGEVRLVVGLYNEA